jgi:hypothetical protein
MKKITKDSFDKLLNSFPLLTVESLKAILVFLAVQLVQIAFLIVLPMWVVAVSAELIGAT